MDSRKKLFTKEYNFIDLISIKKTRNNHLKDYHWLKSYLLIKQEDELEDVMNGKFI